VGKHEKRKWAIQGGNGAFEGKTAKSPGRWKIMDSKRKRNNRGII
jgi:hypothetical protein